MQRQLTLFDEPDLPEPKYNVFLAILPDPYATGQITVIGNSIRRRHGIQTRLRPIGRLHVSLHSNDGAKHPLEISEKAIDQACKSVTAATRPFEIKFDRVMSFGGKPGNRPLVLVDDDHENIEVTRLRESLYAEFAKFAPSFRSSRKLNPHVTLLYDNQKITPEPVEPVSWRVKEIVLVHGEIGAMKYERLGSWALGE